MAEARRGLERARRRRTAEASLASAFTELTRHIADYTNGPWPTAAPHGPAPSAYKAPAGPCALRQCESDPTQEQIERCVYVIWQRAAKVLHETAEHGGPFVFMARINFYRAVYGAIPRDRSLPGTTTDY